MSVCVCVRAKLKKYCMNLVEVLQEYYLQVNI